MNERTTLSRRMMMKCGAGAIGAASLTMSFGASARPRRGGAKTASSMLTPAGAAIVAAIAAKIRHSIALGSSGKARLPAGSAGAVALAYLATRSSTRRAAGKANATALLGGSLDARTAVFGAYASADKSAHDKSAPMLDAAANTAVDKLRRGRGQIFKTAPPKPKPKVSFPKYEKVQWHLNTVKCIDETDGESGSDELLMAGTLVDPKGKVIPIDAWKVHDDFDDGEQKSYDWTVCAAMPKQTQQALGVKCLNGSAADPYRGRKLGGFAMSGYGTQGSLLTLVMAEEDPGGGFNEMVEQLYATVKVEVDKVIVAGGQQIAAQMGGGSGWEALFLIIALVVIEVLEWLIGLIDNPDDRIGARSWLAEIPSTITSSIEGLFGGQHLTAPAGVWATPVQTLDYVGDGGHYSVSVHWRAFDTA